jgi:hypothetical protein
VGLLCAPCVRGLGENAIAADRLYAELELDLVDGGGGAGGGGVNPFPSVSFNAGVAKTRAEIRNCLVTWCRIVGDEVGYDMMGWRVVPIVIGTEGPRRRARIAKDGLNHLGLFLSYHRAWIAWQTWADEICDQLAGMAQDGLRQQDTARAGHVDVRDPCPVCQAPMTAIVRREMNSPTEAVCTGEEPHRWQGERALAELGRLVGAREEWLSARDITRRYGPPIGTVQRLAFEEKWRRTDDNRRPVLYQPDDVRETMKKFGKHECATDPNSEMKEAV